MHSWLASAAPTPRHICGGRLFSVSLQRGRQRQRASTALQTLCLPFSLRAELEPTGVRVASLLFLVTIPCPGDVCAPARGRRGATRVRCCYVARQLLALGALASMRQRRDFFILPPYYTAIAGLNCA